MTDYDIAIDILIDNPVQLGINAGYDDLHDFHNQHIFLDIYPYQYNL
jgi:hypothetical protein